MSILTLSSVRTLAVSSFMLLSFFILNAFDYCRADAGETAIDELIDNGKNRLLDEYLPARVEAVYNTRLKNGYCLVKVRVKNNMKHEVLLSSWTDKAKETNAPMLVPVCFKWRKENKDILVDFQPLTATVKIKEQCSVDLVFYVKLPDLASTYELYVVKKTLFDHNDFICAGFESSLASVVIDGKDGTFQVESVRALPLEQNNLEESKD